MPAIHTIGAVSYLNALPLIHGLDGNPGLSLECHVPSALLDVLLGHRLNVALCPVIDFQRSPKDLTIVPAGAIGCQATTLTVRVFGRTPFERSTTLWVDGDSHTSVALAQVIFAKRFGLRPHIRVFSERTSSGSTWSDVDHMLLIGDKVVTREPTRLEFPHQLDLGEAWRDLTGLPFVFATWMTEDPRALGPVPDLLTAQLEDNARNLDRHLPGWAAAHGWPEAVARHYVSELLVYTVGPPQMQAMTRFWTECRELELFPTLRPLKTFTG